MNDNTQITMGQLKNYLKQNDLIIAPKEDLQAEVAIKQAAYLRKKFLSISEVMDGKFFPKIKTRQTLDNWLKKGKLKKDQDWITDKNGRKVILTSYLKKVVNI